MGEHLHVVKGSFDVYVNGLVDGLGQISLGISFTMDVLCLDLCSVNLENFYPEALPLALYLFDISPEQALFDDRVLQDFIHIFIKLK